MPWDETELWVADLLEDGSVGAPRLIAGGRGESVFQPEWSPDGVLYFVSDRSGWWNLYRWRDGQREALAPLQAEFGVPAWTLGSRTYAFESADRLFCRYLEEGRTRLAALDTRSKRLTLIETPYTEAERGDIKAARGRVVMVAAAQNLPSCLLSLNPDSGEVTRLRQSRELTVDAGYLSAPRPIAFETADGDTAHAIYYPPCNRDYEGAPGERPPLLVKSHGGPTGATSAALSLGNQFWTSRGIAVVDVNYGGSTGYGTAYRRRLNGRWGIVDVDDCINAALHLVRAGEVDGDRLLVTGGSAGGYTTLAALTFRNVFRAGASYYGISDLEALAKETHKFESRYLDSLVGPYPERRDRYLERSPIHHTERLSCPIILLQGLEDRVVPPNQAEMMVAALRRKGLPVAYLPFPGEQHGFRKAKNAKRALEAELYFYSRILGFDARRRHRPRRDREPLTLRQSGAGAAVCPVSARERKNDSWMRSGTRGVEASRRSWPAQAARYSRNVRFADGSQQFSRLQSRQREGSSTNRCSRLTAITPLCSRTYGSVSNSGRWSSSQCGRSPGQEYRSATRTA